MNKLSSCGGVHFADQNGRVHGAVVGGTPRPAHFGAMRILILEDDPLQRTLLRAILGTYGVGSVIEAEDGARGLALLGDVEHEFDIVISDLKMAGMDGIEFMRHAARRQIRGFILSSALEPELLAAAETVVRGYGIPLLGVLAKPIGLEPLRAMLSLFLVQRAGDVVAERTPPTRPWSKRELVNALDQQQFLPFFQPKVNMASKRVDGVEILARWNHPQRGILAPAQFIGVMEDEGLIERLTDTMLRQSLACARAWSEQGWPQALALNISALTFQNIGMPDRILSMVNEYGIAPEQVTIEMTETALAGNAHNVLETVTRLRMNGFKISIDDFGTGYSSLQQLSAIPFTELKIDRSFVAGAARSAKSRAILASMMDLARTLGLRTVAEGIETPAEHDLLESFGCTSGQGYLYARPMAQGDLRRWYAAQ